MRIIKIGTRGSKLSLAQTNWVISKFREIHKEIPLTLKIIQTRGDREEKPLRSIPGKGFFVKEIEEELLNRKIDMAVHSMKDVPVDLPPGLCISVVTERLDPRDAFISCSGLKLEEIPKGSTVGTCSARRQMQILTQRPDLRIQPLRGNLDTRLKKLKEGKISSIVVAACGLQRLGLEDEITEILPEDIFLPSAGQGAIGIEIRSDDDELKELLIGLNHLNTQLEVEAERSFIKRLGGGCRAAVGVLGRVDGEEFLLQAIVGVPGKQPLRMEVRGGRREAMGLAKELAERMLTKIGRRGLRRWQ